MDETLPTPGSVNGGTTAPRPPEGRRDLVSLLAALAVVLMPFPVIVTTLAERRGGYDFQAIVFPSDIVLVALLIVCLPHMVRERSRLGPVLATAAVLVALLAVSWAVHPADRGFLNVVRFAGVVALAWALRDSWHGDRRTLVFGAVAFAAVVQAVLAVVQLVTEDAVGLGALGEFPSPFYTFGDRTLAPQGTMVHIYLLAGLALLASTVVGARWVRDPSRRGWLVAAGVAVVPVAITYSRAALVGLVLALAALVGGWIVTRRRALLVLTATFAGAVAVAALIWPSGWSARASDTAVNQDADSRRTGLAAATTGRTILMRQARDLIEDAPVFGVGTGRYVMELRDRGVDPRPTTVLKPVHDVPLLLAAEAGVAAGLVTVALLVLLAWRAWIGGPAALAVYLAYLPYVLLDHFPYSFPQGQIMTGVWIGVIELLAADRRRSADLA